MAVQPIYSHPYTVAKQVTSLAHLHDRRVYLNMVAGGFTSDLKALNDTTPHDLRYERLTEYTTIIHRLLASPSPLSFEGQFYRVENLKLAPPIPPELFPGILLAGSSEAGLRAAHPVSEGSPARTKRPPGGSPTRASRKTGRGSWPINWR